MLPSSPLGAMKRSDSMAMSNPVASSETQMSESDLDPKMESAKQQGKPSGVEESGSETTLTSSAGTPIFETDLVPETESDEESDETTGRRVY